MTQIRFELEFEDGGFSQGVARATTNLQRLEAQTGRTVVAMRPIREASQGLLGTMRDLTTVFGLAGMAMSNIHSVSTGLVGQVVKVNAEFEKMTTLLKGMSNAADPLKEATQQVKFLRDFAQTVPFSIGALTDSFTKMKATGIDPMTGSLKSLTDGIAAMGGTDSQLQRATLAMTQMSGKGVIQMEELRQQLGEAMPRAVELMARSMGVSMSQLIKDIATGTVEAKPALAALSRELDRTYGGAAQEQMKTWNGQMTIMTSNLQNFALKIGEGGFFDAMKAQLTDLNQFLSSGAASALANDISKGLTTAVTALRSAIDWMVKYKNEIMAVGTAMAFAFGGKMAFGAISTIQNVFQGIASAAGVARTQIDLMYQSVQSSTAATAAANANRTAQMIATAQLGGMVAGSRNPLAAGGATAGVSTAAQSFNALANGANNSATALGNVGRILTGVGSALFVMAPQLAVVGLAVYAAAEYFGLLSNKSKEAWESVQKYGIGSDEQLKLANEHLNKQIAQLERLDKARAEIAARDVARQNAVTVQGRKRAGVNNIGLTEADSKELDGERSVLQGEALTNSIQMERLKADRQRVLAAQAANAARDELNNSMQAAQREYDLKGIRLNELATAKRNKLIEEKRDVSMFEADTSAEQKKYALELHDYRIARMEAAQGVALKMMQEENAQRRANGEAILADVTKRLDEERKLRAATEAQAAGIAKVAKAPNNAELYDKGTKLLEKLKADGEGLRAAFQGADKEVVALQERMKKGLFGPDELEVVKKLTAEITNAKQEAEDLNKIVQGGSKMEQEALNIERKAREELIDLQLKAAGKENASDTEKFELKKSMGFFDGWGRAATPAQQRLVELRQSMTEFGKTSQGVGQSLQNELFGGPVISAAQGFLSMVEKISGAINGLRNGGSLGALFGGMTGGAVGSMTTAMTGDAMEIYRKAIAMIESRGGPNNGYGSLGPVTGKGDRAYGKYQIMGANIGPWSEEALGTRMTAPDFLANPEAQDKIFNHMFGKLMKQHGSAEDAAHAWLTGRPRGQSNAADANGTTGPAYVAKFLQNMATLRAAPNATPATNETGYGQTDPAIGRAKETEQLIKALKPGVMIKDLVKNFQSEMDAAMESAADEDNPNGKRERAMRAMIKKGKINPENTDVDSDEYTELLAKAAEFDRKDKEFKDKRIARTKAVANEERMVAKMDDLKQRKADMDAAVKDPNAPEATRAFQALREEVEKYLATVEKAYGKTSDEYKLAAQRGQEMLNIRKSTTAQEANLNMIRDTKKNVRDAMNEPQRLRAALEDEAAQRRAAINVEGVDLETKKQMWVNYFAWYKSEVEKLNANTPLAQLGRQWEDLGKNMETSMASAFGSLTDGLAGLLTGQKVNFQQMFQNFAKDIMKNVLNAAFAPLMKSMGGMFSGMLGGGGAKGGGAAKGGGLAKAGVMHTGGIVGAGGMSRMVSAGLFSGAPRFHTGGIIGSNEVPIIAQKGEGVFTPAQMQAMGSSNRVVQLQNQVTVNASGGTKEQNDDLAKQVSKQVEQTARAMVVDEMRRQMRPGNMMNR